MAAALRRADSLEGLAASAFDADPFAGGEDAYLSLRRGDRLLLAADVPVKEGWAHGAVGDAGAEVWGWFPRDRWVAAPGGPEAAAESRDALPPQDALPPRQRFIQDVGQLRAAAACLAAATSEGRATHAFSAEGYGPDCLSFAVGQPLLRCHGFEREGWVYGAAGGYASALRWGWFSKEFWAPAQETSGAGALAEESALREALSAAKSQEEAEVARVAALNGQVRRLRLAHENAESQLASERTSLERAGESFDAELSAARREAETNDFHLAGAEERADAADRARGDLTDQLRRGVAEAEALAEANSGLEAELRDRSAQAAAFKREESALQEELASSATANPEASEERLQAAMSELEAMRAELEAARTELKDAQAASGKASTVAGLDDCDWQYLGPGGAWCCMPPDTSTRLSDAFRVYHAGGPETLSLSTGQYPYNFDFKAMKQHNTRTGVARDIRVNFDIPEHWEIDAGSLLEQHLEALPMRELPRRGGIPGGFSAGQEAYIVHKDAPTEGLTRCGTRGLVLGVATGEGADEDGVDFATDMGTVQVSARWLGLQGPELACGLHIGETVYCDETLFLPMTADSRGVVTLPPEGQLPMPEDRVYVSFDGKKLHRMKAAHLSPHKQGRGQAHFDGLRIGQEVFNLYAFDVGSNSVAPGALLELLGLDVATSTLSAALRDYPDLPAVILTARDAQKLLSPTAPAMVGGFRRGQDVSWRAACGDVHRGVAVCPSLQGDPAVVVAFPCGNRWDCDVEDVSASPLYRPRRLPKQLLSHSHYEMRDLLSTCVYHHSRNAASGECDMLQQRVEVREIFHIENWQLWRNYERRRQKLRDDLERYSITPEAIDPPLQESLRALARSIRAYDSSLNEVLLFHGTKRDDATSIISSGFDFRLARQGLYGMGTYFAPQFCKAHTYTAAEGAEGTRTLIIARVLVGEPHFATRLDKKMRRPPVGAGEDRPVDSVIVRPGRIGDHMQTHQEVVIFDRAQAYPEYIVEYSVAD